jgi:hypothetical protein
MFYLPSKTVAKNVKHAWMSGKSRDVQHMCWPTIPVSKLAKQHHQGNQDMCSFTENMPQFITCENAAATLIRYKSSHNLLQFLSSFIHYCFIIYTKTTKPGYYEGV